ncbi:hypothetical protein COCMIDRAFT_1773 [Bipolaris oryzae ATCC 44560]|uniref:Kinetochore protein mis14 n=1 Tax=Bipolaris oryzae ATCC 44560 TaxID=930090 RepID=W6ZHR5_COCMI|nr:uncharacterized protein COCMIDRAFT_1773 [Bipolaris oryzae ATCC 44560]EUC49530.1 hypothetical protein COCMIDRAFT_1773 [Bipolaris oryzae ATCC 44560]
MDSSHRKIELQSPSDLTYLTTQIRTAARQKLDLHLPPVTSATAAEPDDLRRSVEDLVDAFVAHVLRGMRQNISINGIDIVGPDAGGQGDDAMQGLQGLQAGEAAETATTAVEREEFEAFDEKLRTRLGDAVARRDALIAKISQHRRATPAVAAKAFQERFEREGVEAEEKWAGVEERVNKVVGEGDVAAVESGVRQEEVQRNWERAVEALQALNKGLPETRARLERAGDVVGYLGGK